MNFLLVIVVVLLIVAFHTVQRIRSASGKVANVNENNVIM